MTNKDLNNLPIDFINHIHSIKNKDLLTSCLGKELKDIKIKEFSYANNDPEISQLLLRFDKWISITIEDDHVSVIETNDLTDFEAEGVRFKFVDSKTEMNVFKNLKMKNYFTITNDSRFAFGICFDFDENNRFIFANLAYDKNGKDYKQIII